jgi:hypothetical protein
MFISTALCCVLAAVWGGLLRAMQDPKDVDFKNMLFYLVLAIGAPMFVMMGVGAVSSLRRALTSWRKRKDKP